MRYQIKFSTGNASKYWLSCCDNFSDNEKNNFGNIWYIFSKMVVLLYIFTVSQHLAFPTKYSEF